MDRQAVRRTIGYDEPWERAGVLDEMLLDDQARALATDPHAEHHRWGMWRAYVGRRATSPIDDATFAALLALDTHEATRPPPTFGHGIALDPADSFSLTDTQLAQLERHPVTHGLSHRTPASLLAKIAARRVARR